MNPVVRMVWQAALAGLAAGGLGPAVLAQGIGGDTGSCTEVPTLRAAQGGGTIELKREGQARIPYGVRYAYRRAISGADAVYVTIRGGRAEGETTVAAALVATDNDCREAMLPPFASGRPVTIVERVATRPDATQRADLEKSIQQLRRAWIDSLYSGYVLQGILAGDLSARLASVFGSLPGVSTLGNWTLITEGAQGIRTVALRDTLRALFVAAAASTRRDGIVSLPYFVADGQKLARFLQRTFIEGNTCSRPGTQPSATARDSASLRELAESLARLARAVERSAIADLYDNGVLPLETRRVDDLGRLLTAACGGIDSTQVGRLTQFAAGLVSNPFGPLLAVMVAARQLVEQSFSVTAVDYQGLTTILQRYGQLDVVNAYFFDTKEARLVATFSIYPAALRYGAERDPQIADDRFVVQVGYSLTRTVAAASDTTPDATVFVVGVGLRLNSAVGIGFGRAIGRGIRSWYLSVSGDLGSVPFLQDLFVRKPAQ